MSQAPKAVKIGPILAFLGGLSVATWWLATASAQQDGQLFQSPPSDIRKPLERAKKAIEDERFSDAVAELGGMLLSESTDVAEQQDYFLDADDAANRRKVRCLKAEAQNIIAGLPAAARELYELQFGAQAKALLDEAIREGDQAKLAEVTRKFLHTKAGAEAAMLAGRLELAAGRPVAAALCFQRVAAAPGAAQFEPELSLLTATCWSAAGMPTKAQATLVSLKKRFPNAAIEAGAQKIELFQNEADALAWLEKFTGPRRPIRGLDATEWVMFRGNGQRNGSTLGSLPLINCRWFTLNYVEPRDEKIILRQAKNYRDKSIAALPAFQPLAVGNTILMRTPHKLQGVDFQSGKLIWVWPWDDETGHREAALPQSRHPNQTGDVREQELHQRIWEDAVHGQLSSDGKSAFVLSGLGYASSQTQIVPIMFVGPGGAGQAYPGAPKPYNELVSLNLEKQGKLQWIVGGPTGEDEPKLAGAFFLGPPLPMQGSLYAVAEFNGEVRLVVLDAKDGRLQWQQQLAHVDVQTVVNDGVRRLAGATPSYSGGVLICPTSAGAVVAVDVATHGLLWGQEYRRSKPPAVNQGFGFQQVQTRGPKEPGKHWADAAAIIADGRVLMTPVEAEPDWDKLFCFDLLTGDEVWAVDRGNRLFVACVDGDRAIVVGGDEVVALKLADGQPAWSQPVKLETPPSGRGFYSDHFYFLPTAGSELLKIDLQKGEIAARTRTGDVLGNILCHRGEVISQSVDRLATYFQSDPLRGLVEQKLKENPNDTWALSRKGELLLQDGQKMEAIAMLRKAYELQPDDDGTRSLLVTTLLAGLQDDFVGLQAQAAEIEKLIDRPQQRSEFLRLMAVGWQKTGDTAKAFDAYLGLAQWNGEAVGSFGPAELEIERVERNLGVRMDRWLQARFDELLAAASPPERAKMEDSIRGYFESALKADDLSVLRRFVRYFGGHPLANELRLRLAHKLAESGEILEAELLLTRLIETGGEAWAPAATAEMASLLLTARQYEPAERYFADLAGRWADTVCTIDKSAPQLTGRQIFEAAMQDKQLLEAAQGKAPWPYGKVTVEDKPDPSNRHPSYRRVFASQIMQRSGPSPTGLSVSYDQAANSLVIADGWGRTLTQVGLGNVRLSTADYNLTHTRANGHLLLVSTGMELIAVDILQAMKNPSEGVRWRRQMLQQSPGVSVYQMLVRVKTLTHPLGLSNTRRVFSDQQDHPVGMTGPLLDTGAFYISSRELVCADPLTGETIWSRDNLPPGCDLFGDRELIFVVPPGTDEALVFSAIDGRELGKRKVAALDNRWATSGRKVLEWQEAGSNGALRLRLFDAWSGQALWIDQLTPGAKATLVDCDELAIVQADGRCRIRTLNDDRIVVQDQLEPEPSLLSLHVLRSRDQYLLATNRPYTQVGNAPPVFIQSMINGQNEPLITGNIYAYDRRTGNRSWQSPAYIERFGFPLDQPTESPLLFFVRQLRFTQPQANRSAVQTSVLCLDRRDGRAVVENDQIPVQTYTYDIVSERLKSTVTLGLPGRTIEVKLTDEDVAPAPPAQTGSAAPITAQAKSPAADAIADAVIEPIRGAAEIRRAFALPARRIIRAGQAIPAQPEAPAAAPKP